MLIHVIKISADYILTKPIHKSQVLVKKFADDFIKIQINLIVNFELKAHLLSYGANIEILEPEVLRMAMYDLYNEALKKYQ